MMSDPIHFPGRLPDAVLVRPRPQPGAQPGPAPDPIAPPRPEAPPAGPPAPVWLSCDDTPEENPLHRWPTSNGQVAVAVPANASGTARGKSGTLLFRAGVNSGLCLPDALPDLAHATVAAIFRPAPGASAGTVLSLQPQDGGGYVFLAHDEGQIRLGRKDSDLSLTAAAPDGSFLAGMVFSDGEVAVFINDRMMARTPLALAGPTDLFIGCRNARAGLKNKLGSFALTDVLIWPGEGRPDLAAACALCAKRGRNGL